MGSGGGGGGYIIYREKEDLGVRKEGKIGRWNRNAEVKIGSERKK